MVRAKPEARVARGLPGKGARDAPALTGVAQPTELVADVAKAVTAHPPFRLGTTAVECALGSHALVEIPLEKIAARVAMRMANDGRRGIGDLVTGQQDPAAPLEVLGNQDVLAQRKALEDFVADR